MEKLKHKVDRPFWFRLTNQMNGRELDGREVPHSCSDPSCPGDINRRKLEAAEEMARSLKAMLGQYEDTYGEDFCECQKGQYWSEGHVCDACQARMALSAWDEAGKATP